MKKQLAIALTVASMAVASNQELTQTFDITHAPDPQATDWDDILSLPQFDTLGGTRTLDSVTVKLDGKIEGAIGVENTSPSSGATITSKLGANITASGPGGVNLAVSPASGPFVDVATTFDNVFDFGGTSGFTHPNLAASGSDSTSPALAPYIGNGNVDFSVEAIGASTASGGGSLLAQFDTKAGAKVTVTYEWHETTTTPDAGSTVALLGGALVAIGSLRRKF